MENNDKSSRQSISKRKVLRRTVILMALCGVGFFIPLLARLWTITIVDHDEYQARAARQRAATVQVSASRGEILDANDNVMAVSATVYNLILSPLDLVNSVDEKKFKKDGVTDEAAYQGEIDRRRSAVVDGLMALFPDMDRENLTRRMEKTYSQYEVLRTKIETENAQKVRELLTELKTSNYLYLTPDTKRYYPYGALASQALGFTNANGGAYGLEAYYNDLLEGDPGWVLTERTGRGIEMYSSYSDYIDAANGFTLKLSIDTTIQSYAEKALEEGIRAYDIQNGAFCIVLDPNNGEIKAIASSPEFDPNSYSSVTDERLLAKAQAAVSGIYEQLKSNNTEGKTDAELQTQAENQAMANAQFTMWSNKAINEAYEPGSTFKAMVLAAALEEGVVSESDTFYCSGSYMVPGWSKPISCSKHSGHGTQTLAQAVQNSCNPAFMQIGQRLGIEKFYEYFEAFGLKEQTGVDLPGEGISQVWEKSAMTNVDLAVGSFGQRFKITPLQNIRAFAAVINGGYLLTPHVVQSVSKDGTMVSSTETQVVRQVISQETSATCRKILESVVSEGTGGNAYVAGYRIGGKTGTSETEVDGEVIVSFMGFAPADDPQVLVLLAYDRPKRSSPGSNYGTTGVYISGGNMAAKQAGKLIANILDYMGAEKTYTKDESAAVDVQTPGVTGMTVTNAAAALEKKGLKYRTVGEGDTVTTQIPARGASVPGGSSMILYLGNAAPEESAQVPNVVGLGYDAARAKLEKAGFFMRASGTNTFYGNASKVSGQSVAAGESAALGTVVDVQFTNVVEDGWVNTG